ncbi:ABC transporter permease [Aeromicrobium sp. CTD01-1L150]|uniref:ABC transporter permease n=1 Tax=Aeromicrobium sp. CTD01-1L150 TaxID=3341830 RepID=UPI0035C1CCDC
MVTYALHRLALALPVIIIVACGTFALVYLMPGDPATTIAGDGASTADIAAVRTELGLDKSFLAQFGGWLAAAVTGDFGRSFQYNVPVAELIGQRIGVTASIVVVGWLLAVLLGVPVGLLAGMRPGTLVDRALTGIATLGIALPSFWLAMLLISLFALQLGWFDATGYTPLSAGVGPWLKSLLLPGLAVASTSAADIARQTRSSVITVGAQDFVRTNRATGLAPLAVMRHVLRNSGVPIATVAGLQVERLIGSAVVVEILFAMPGVGELMLRGVQTQDLPVIQGVVVLVAAAVIVVNLLVDVSYVFINPRLRRQS